MTARTVREMNHLLLRDRLVVNPTAERPIDRRKPSGG